MFRRYFQQWLVWLPLALCFFSGNVVAAPTASFTATPTSGVSPLTVQLDASASTGTGLSYEWDFGDASPKASGSDKVTVSHEYVTATANQTYTITLKVTASDGTNTATKTITVNPSVTPISVTATATPANVDEGGKTSQLKAVAKNGTGGFTYTWVPNAGAPADAASRLSATAGSTVTFTSPGNVNAQADYTYIVTAKDSGNNTATDEVTVTVEDVPIKATVGDTADFDEGTTRTLTASVTPTGSYNYSWKITAGGSSAQIDGSKTSPTVKIKAGQVAVDQTITVELTVTDKANTARKDTATATMKVKNVTATFTPTIAGSGDFNEGATKLLTADERGGKAPYTYKWEITGGDAAVQIDGSSAGKTVKLHGKEVAADTSIAIKLTVTDSSLPKLTKTATTTMKVKNVTATFTPTITGAGDFDEGATKPLTANEGGGKAPYTYKWEITAGNAAVQIDGGNTDKTVKLKGKEVADDTSIAIKLTVTDSSVPKLTKIATTTMKVKNVLKKPVAKITVDPDNPDNEVGEGEKVILDGSASNDPDGTIKSYVWTSVDPAIELNIKDGKPEQASFSAPRVGKAGKVLTFSLKVIDDSDQENEATVTITVKNTKNDPPKAVIAQPDSIEPGAAFVLDGSISTDLDGNDTIKTYKWTQPPESPESPGDRLRVVIVEGDSAVGRFKAPAIDQKSVQLTLILEVTDEEGLPSTTEQVVTVTFDKDLKQPQAKAGNDDIAETGRVVTLDGSKSRDTNEDGSIVSYEWKQLSGVLVPLTDADKAQASFIAPAGTQKLEFELKVTDNDNLFAIDKVSVFVGPKTSLQVDAGQDQIDVEEGSTVTLSGSVLNGTGTEQKLRWRQAGATGTSVILSDIDKANVHFVTPPVNGGKDAMTLAFEFASWDNIRGVGVASVNVTVKDNGVVNVPDEFVPVRAAVDSEAGVGFDIQSGNLIKLDPRKAPLNERATQKNRPKSIPYGLFDFSLKVENPSDSVTLRVWFPEDMSSGYDWFKYDSKTETWTPYENVVFQGNEALITMTDGGPGDDDGKADGVIRDPSGPGSKVATTKTKIEGSSGGGAMIWGLTLLVAGAGLRRKQTAKAA